MSLSKKINAEQLLDLLDLPAPCDRDRGAKLAAKYRSWRAFDPVDNDDFVLIGTLDCGDLIDREYPSESSYWSADYPIAVRYYPNCGASVYAACGGYYLVVREFGGHVPERRCRHIRRELIVN